MRRSKVNNASLATATIAELSRHSVTASLGRTRSRSWSWSRSRSRSRSQSIRLCRQLVFVTVIGLHLQSVLGLTTTTTTTTAAAAAAAAASAAAAAGVPTITATTTATVTTASTSTSGSGGQNHSTENNFYFDEQNTSRTVAFIAADTAISMSEVSPVPTEAHTLRVLTTARLRDGGTEEAATFSDSHGGQLTAVLSPTGLATATTKSVRSVTMKQTIDAARSRNHWAVGGVTDAERSRTFRSKYHHENHYGPFFEEPSNLIDPGKTLVSAVHLFTEAVLNCRVGMLKDKTVMWVRRTTEKVSLLTVGNVTYSGDPRIRVKFQYPNNWRLMINPTHREDAGIYMCQVSTHPPRVFTTNLTILEPPLRIIDEHERDVGDRYYKSGSTVDLQCQISRNFFQKERHAILKSIESGGKSYNDTTSELKLIADVNQTHNTYSSQELEKYFTNFITWAKDEEPLQALTNRRSSVSDKWLNSRISIADAKLSDSGNYSCSLGRLFTVIVQVQVLTGELPAAVQHNLARRSDSCSSLSWSLFIIVICFYILNSHSSQFHSIKTMNAS